VDQEETAKILVVDDLAENLLGYRAILEELGQQLVMVRSGEEALKEVLRHEFAVILLDVNMPGLDGLETAALIRARKKSAHTPIIFLTAFTDELRVSEGYAQGAVDFIATPAVPAILRAKIKVFVDLFRMTEQVKRHAEERIAHAKERTQREAVEESNRRLSFLARAGAIITKSLDPAVTLESILRLLVPEHADQAVIAEQDETGRWRVTLALIEGKRAAILRADGLGDLPGSFQQAIERAAASGATVSTPDTTDDNLQAARLLALPMRDRERVFGVLLVVGTPQDGYSLSDVAMFESIAWRSAIALVNATLYQEIERADQHKNRFLSLLAHELRNPLAPIRSAVDVLRLCGDSLDDIGWARDVIDRQVSHLVRLVDDLLDVSRITLGKIRLELGLVDAADAVHAAVEISRPLIVEGGHELSVSVPDEPLLLTGDRARLTQVLSNLLNNAAKYTPRGGSIWLSLAQEGDDAVFRVRDSGIGIPGHMLDKVFDMFIQVEDSLDRAQGGLGVGLTLVREIVTMHQGSITVASEGQGRGSEFMVRIPCSAAPVPAQSNLRLARGAPAV
jgi:signal transduction histidine kinase/DNA-binding response OmpR family regulator